MCAINYIYWTKKLAGSLGVAGASVILGLPAVGQLDPTLSINSPYNHDRLAEAIPTTLTQILHHSR